MTDDEQAVLDAARAMVAGYTDKRMKSSKWVRLEAAVKAMEPPQKPMLSAEAVTYVTTRPETSVAEDNAAIVAIVLEAMAVILDDLGMNVAAGVCRATAEKERAL